MARTEVDADEVGSAGCYFVKVMHGRHVREFGAVEPLGRKFIERWYRSKPSVKWPLPDDKTLARAREMSPVTYIRPGLPPTFIVYGDSDHTVDPRQDIQLKKALDAGGVPNGIDVIVGRGHGGFSKEENDKSKLLCLEFLNRQLILQ